MKKMILFLFVVAIASTNGFSQGPQGANPPKKTPEQRAENMTKRLTKELNLNADQQIKAKAVILKREQEREKKMKENHETLEKINGEFKTFLTAEQYQKLQQKEAEVKRKRADQRKQAAPKKSAPQVPVAPGN